MAIIKTSYIVKKRNVLNEIRANGLSLQELRFFSIYLSKINPDDISTRIVRFPISDFQKIMDLGKISIEYLKQVTNKLLCKIVNVPDQHGGYTGFQLFKRCKVSVDNFGEWYIEIDAHDDALPLMFEFKEKYFTYRLWNALQLKSSNQLRMYEILKQYEKIGERILSIDELREFLGIKSKEYPRFNNFKQWVLDACQQALKENTDIKFTYEPYGKRGKGGKIAFLKFTIMKNENYVDKLTLDKFLSKAELKPTIGEIVATVDSESDDDKQPKEAKREVDEQPKAKEPAKTNEQPQLKAKSDKLEAYRGQLDKLDFIQGDLTEREKLSILKAAKGDVELIANRYYIAVSQGNIESLVRFLVWAVREPDDAFKTSQTSVAPKNIIKVNNQKRGRFCNFEDRDRNFKSLESVERGNLG